MTDATTVSDRSHRRRTQAERRARATKALLKGAEQLIARQGITGTSIAEIGAVSGYSRGLVTHYFGTKDRLIETLVDRHRRKFLSSIAGLEAENGLGGLLKLVNAWIELTIPAVPYVRAFLVLHSSGYPEAKGSADLAGYDEGSREVIQSWIRKGQGDGSVRTDLSPEAGAWAVLGLARGLGAQLLIAPDAVDKEELKSESRAFLRAALAAPVELEPESAQGME